MVLLSVIGWVSTLSDIITPNWNYGRDPSVADDESLDQSVKLQAAKTACRLDTAHQKSSALDKPHANLPERGALYQL